MLESLKKNETLEYQKLTPEEMEARGILGRLVGVCADFMNPTRNGRKYGEDLWEHVFEDPLVQEKISNGVCFGELGHPADRTETDMEKIAVCLREQPKKNSEGQLVACFDILDTPNGRILKHYVITVQQSESALEELEMLSEMKLTQTLMTLSVSTLC